MKYESSIELYPKQVELWLHQLEDRFVDGKPAGTIVGYGGARGGTKSYTMRTFNLIRRLCYSHSTSFIFRLTLPELKRTQIDPLFDEHPWVLEYYKEKDNKIVFPNGSITYFGYGETYDDIRKWRGANHDDLFLDEVTEMPERFIKFLLTTNRRSGGSAQKVAKAFIGGNPGGPGHAWFKRVFIERDSWLPRENPHAYTFMQSYLWDNYHWIEGVPGIPQVSKHDYFFEWTEEERREFCLRYSPYVDTLNSLDDYEYQAAVFGNWDTFEGQFFGRYNPDIHCIAPFDIPQHWNVIAGLDWGNNLALEVVAVSPDKQYYAIDELFMDATDLGAEGRATEIAKWFRDKNYPLTLPIVADHDVFYKYEGNTKNSPSTHLRNCGLRNLRRVDKLKIEGKDYRLAANNFIKDRLYWRKDKDGEFVARPSLQIFRGRCPNLVRTLPLLMADINRPGDFKHDSKNKNDHCYDALKYGAMNVYTPMEIIEAKEDKTYVPPNRSVAVVDYSDNPYCRY